MNIDQIPNEKDPKILIAELEKSFQDWIGENPDLAGKVKKDLIGIFGYDESEISTDGLAIIKAPIEKLSIFGTSCGTVGNKAFDRNVLNFFKTKGVEFIVAISNREEPSIYFAVIKVNEKDGEKLSDMIAENDGSLRCDTSSIDGWSTFESE